MRILTVGDVVGISGTEYIRRNLWRIRNENKIDMTILNGENAAKGNGLDKETAEVLFSSGADVITSGNHIWHKHETKHFIDDFDNILRPANFPKMCPGNGYTIYDASGIRVLVISLLGNVYMPDTYSCPFEKAKEILTKHENEYDICAVDFHGEATSEKIAFAKYFDGKINICFGTHTHVQTNDIKILPLGTGFITDVGMTGVYDSILGVKNECIIEKFLTKMPVKFEEATGETMFNGAVFEIDEKSGKCTEVITLNFCHTGENQ